MDNIFSDSENLFETIAENPLLSAIIIASIAFLIILITREIRCWYWKIEEKLELQKQELATLTEIVDLQKTQIRLLESNISKMNQLIFNTAAIDEAAPTKNKEEE